jgi:hypothetical protein
MINWKLIAFWVLLWWFVYSAPTEGTIAHLLLPQNDDGSQYVPAPPPNCTFPCRV